LHENDADVPLSLCYRNKELLITLPPIFVFVLIFILKAAHLPRLRKDRRTKDKDKDKDKDKE